MRRDDALIIDALATASEGKRVVVACLSEPQARRLQKRTEEIVRALDLPDLGVVAFKHVKTTEGL